MKNFILLILVSVIALSGCKNEKKVVDTNFPYISLPMYINDSYGEEVFLAKNFWNKFFKGVNKDTTLMFGVDNEKFRIAFAEYIQVLKNLRLEGDVMEYIGSEKENIINSSVEKFVSRLDSLAVAGEKKPFYFVLKNAEEILYNPISNGLDEEIYLPFVKSFLNAKTLSEVDKMQYKYQKEICELNRVGQKANDFEFYLKTKNGEVKSSLYKIKSELTIIFFNNPDCVSCESVVEILDNEAISNYIKENKLSILAMYIDEDFSIWSKNKNKFPDSWIYAYDKNLILRENQKYGLRAIPSFYLLDKDKNVILKDANIDQLAAIFL